MSFLRQLDGGDREGILIFPMKWIPLVSPPGRAPVTVNAFSEDPDSESIRSAMATMKPEQAKDLLETIEACQEELAGLRASMQARCGEFCPPTRNIQEQVQKTLNAARSIARTVAPELVSEVSKTDTNSGAGSADSSSAGGSAEVLSGPIKSRAQALAMLDTVAAFFSSHDPHSFVAYGAKEVARWGRMPLAELLKGNDSAREALTSRLGVAVKEAEKPASPGGGAN